MLNIIKLVYSIFWPWSFQSFTVLTVSTVHSANCIWGSLTPLMCFGDSMSSGDSESCRADEGDPEHLGWQAALQEWLGVAPLGIEGGNRKSMTDIYESSVFDWKTISKSIFPWPSLITGGYYQGNSISSRFIILSYVIIRDHLSSCPKDVCWESCGTFCPRPWLGWAKNCVAAQRVADFFLGERDTHMGGFPSIGDTPQ